MIIFKIKRKRCCISCESFYMEETYKFPISGGCAFHKKYVLGTDTCDNISGGQDSSHLIVTTRGFPRTPRTPREQKNV